MIFMTRSINTFEHHLLVCNGIQNHTHGIHVSPSSRYTYHELLKHSVNVPDEFNSVLAKYPATPEHCAATRSFVLNH
jgi:hypothetical protein